MMMSLQINTFLFTLLVLNVDFCSGYVDAFGKWNTGEFASFYLELLTFTFTPRYYNTIATNRNDFKQ